MKKAIITVLLIVFNTMVLCSCSTVEKAPQKDEFTIVTSFYPIYILTSNITKDIPNVKTVNLTRPTTGCLHDYQLSPSDIKILESADALVINGLGMESFMDKIIAQYPNIKVIDSGSGIPTINNLNSTEPNPHIWVSVSNAILQVKNINKGLSAIAPENANNFGKNTTEYIGKLEILKATMEKELADLKNKNIVTFHEAFPYFAKEFNLDIVSFVEREPGSEPSAGELTKTINAIKEKSVKAIFTEPQYPVKPAETIARETGIKVYILDPITTGPDDINSYQVIMQNNLNTLKEALR